MLALRILVLTTALISFSFVSGVDALHRHDLKLEEPYKVIAFFLNRVVMFVPIDTAIFFLDVFGRFVWVKPFLLETYFDQGLERLRVEVATREDGRSITVLHCIAKSCSTARRAYLDRIRPIWVADLEHVEDPVRALTLDLIYVVLSLYIKDLLVHLFLRKQAGVLIALCHSLFSIE